MSDWNRSTREVSFKQFAPDVVSAIQSHIEMYAIGDILNDILIFIQTDSEKPKKGLFGKAEIISQCAVLTPRWLLWSVKSGGGEPAVLSSQLINIVVQDYSQTKFGNMVPDTGIQITGGFTDASENGSAFIGLDTSTDAKKFMDLIIKAVQDAKK